MRTANTGGRRSEEHTSELQSRRDLVCRLLPEKKKYISTSFILHKKNTIKTPYGRTDRGDACGGYCVTVISIETVSELFDFYIAYIVFNVTATTEIYTLSLHDALPI